MSAQPYCRPNLNFLADRRDLEHCLADLHAFCVRTLGESRCD
jgi:hypothetical protein